jgi:hypothetical protein
MGRKLSEPLPAQTEAGVRIEEEPIPRSDWIAADLTATYVGEETQLGRIVWVETQGERRPLELGDGDASALRLYRWGPPGPAAKALARAILRDATGNPFLAERLCRPFTWEVLARLSPRSFRLTRPQVLRWVEAV